MTEHDLKQALAEAQDRISDLEKQLGKERRICQLLQQRLDYLFHHVPLPIAMFDKEMNYLMVSQQYLYDYKPLETNIIGKNHYDIFPETPVRWREAHQRCLKGVSESCEADPYHTRTGHLLYIDWVVQPWYIENHAVGGLILIARIVNEQVEAQNKLKTLNQELRLSNQKLDAFASAVLHVLHNPLEANLELAQGLSHFLAENGPEEHSMQAKFIQANLKRMERTIQGLLSYARVGEQVGYYELNLHEVLATVIENLQQSITQNDVRIRFGPLPIVKANEFEMIALFQNLIANAIKHHAGPIRIEIGAKQLASHWQFSVSDNGPGISPEDQKTLFQPIRQLELKPSFESVGVGLPVCKRIIEQMKGKIWVESSQEIGTTFHFTIPHLISS